MKIFLTGATGFIGSYFLKEALKKGHTIYAPSIKKRKSKKNLRWLHGSFNKNWKELKKCEVLIHLAAAGVNNKNIMPNEIFGINIIIKNKMIGQNNGCPKCIIVSFQTVHHELNL